MGYGRLLIIQDIHRSHTRPAFDRFLMDDNYDTIVFKDFFSMRYVGHHYTISLYIQPIDNSEEMRVLPYSTTMTKLKKIGGWTYYEGNYSKGSIVGEVFMAISNFLRSNQCPVSGGLVLPVESKTVIEARGSSDWQAVNAVAAQYVIVAAEYKLEE